MRWLVTGAKGMLGQDLVALLGDRGHDVVGIDREEADITDPSSVAGLVDGFDLVANCAAYTAVDAAEAEESTAFGVNSVGPALLARAARAAGARMVQISTDYVFAGNATEPYGESAPIAPRSAYGRTKAAGEWAVRAEAPDHLIVRTAWLYGAHGACFPKTIARVARERGHLDVVADQVGQPTWTADLAQLVLRLVESGAPAGIYHGTSSGRTSWFEFARAVVSAAGMDPAMVRATASTESDRPARRPAFSVLGHDGLVDVGVAPIGAWGERWELAASSVLAG
ncbi:MAG TPA: dTDP-4-dehydrorhamnose reductase [Cellulomonas sp.]